MLNCAGKETPANWVKPIDAHVWSGWQSQPATRAGWTFAASGVSRKRNHEPFLRLPSDSVTKPTATIPYLRLHVEDSNATRRPRDARLMALCDVVRDVTGWSLRVPRTTLPTPAEKSAGDLAAWPAWSVEDTDDSAVSLPPPRLDREAADRLARAVGDVWWQLAQARRAVQQRDAELATCVPVRCREDEAAHLAWRLESILQGGLTALQCQAAALYLLDETTSTLKLRASWGLPLDRLLDPPRTLAQAVADLEALLGHAVVIEDARLLPHWNVPEECGSAVCVPVSSPTSVLGTLWLLCDRPRDFGSTETNLAEIIAGRLAADLDRESLLQEAQRLHAADRSQRQLVGWQRDYLPQFPPPLDGWNLSGAVPSGAVPSSEFFDWSVLPCGTLHCAVGAAHGAEFPAAIAAAGLLTALRAHVRHEHDARKTLDLVNESIWTGSVGGQFASLLHVRAQTESGDCVLCGAGRIVAAVIGSDRCEDYSLHGEYLGEQPDISSPVKRFTLEPGETFVAAALGGQRKKADDVAVETLAKLVRQHGRANSKKLLTDLRRQLPGSILLLQRNAKRRSAKQR